MCSMHSDLPLNPGVTSGMVMGRIFSARNNRNFFNPARKMLRSIWNTTHAATNTLVRRTVQRSRVIHHPVKMQDDWILQQLYNAAIWMMIRSKLPPSWRIAPPSMPLAPPPPGCRTWQIHQDLIFKPTSKHKTLFERLERLHLGTEGV
jgi:hypothetical protein